jgi:hypothetical protein
MRWITYVGVERNYYVKYCSCSHVEEVSSWHIVTGPSGLKGARKQTLIFRRSVRQFPLFLVPAGCGNAAIQSRSFHWFWCLQVVKIQTFSRVSIDSSACRLWKFRHLVEFPLILVPAGCETWGIQSRSFHWFWCLHVVKLETFNQGVSIDSSTCRLWKFRHSVKEFPLILVPAGCETWGIQSMSFHWF